MEGLAGIDEFERVLLQRQLEDAGVEYVGRFGGVARFAEDGRAEGVYPELTQRVLRRREQL